MACPDPSASLGDFYVSCPQTFDPESVLLYAPSRLKVWGLEVSVGQFASTAGSHHKLSFCGLGVTVDSSSYYTEICARHGMAATVTIAFSFPWSNPRGDQFIRADQISAVIDTCAAAWFVVLGYTWYLCLSCSASSVVDVL